MNLKNIYSIFLPSYTPHTHYYYLTLHIAKRRTSSVSISASPAGALLLPRVHWQYGRHMGKGSVSGEVLLASNE